jgi:hypothetical protein
MNKALDSGHIYYFFAPGGTPECSAALTDVAPILNLENQLNVGAQYLIGFPGLV